MNIGNERARPKITIWSYNWWGWQVSLEKNCIMHNENGCNKMQKKHAFKKRVYTANVFGPLTETNVECTVYVQCEGYLIPAVVYLCSFKFLLWKRGWSMTSPFAWFVRFSKIFFVAIAKLRSCRHFLMSEQHLQVGRKIVMSSKRSNFYSEWFTNNWQATQL